MTPYWQSDDGRLVLYHGDARDILPHLSAGALVTDPPYNVGMTYGPSTNDGRADAEYLDWLRSVFSAGARALDAAGPLVWFWTGIRVAYGQVPMVLPAGWRVHHLAAWFKREFAGDLFKSEHPAYSWEPIVWAVREGARARYYGPRGGHAGRDCLIGNSARHDRGNTAHPCPKPLTVVRAVVAWTTAPDAVVLDPFAGSGTTLLAAHQEGRRAIGIEIEERYCDLAARRLDAELRQCRFAWEATP